MTNTFTTEFISPLHGHFKRAIAQVLRTDDPHTLRQPCGRHSGPIISPRRGVDEPIHQGGLRACGSSVRSTLCNEYTSSHGTSKGITHRGSGCAKNVRDRIIISYLALCRIKHLPTSFVNVILSHQCRENVKKCKNVNWSRHFTFLHFTFQEM